MERNQNNRRAVSYLRSCSEKDGDNDDEGEVNFDSVGQDTYLEVENETVYRNDADRQDYIDYTNVNPYKQHTGRSYYCCHKQHYYSDAYMFRPDSDVDLINLISY